MALPVTATLPDGVLLELRPLANLADNLEAGAAFVRGLSSQPS